MGMILILSHQRSRRQISELTKHFRNEIQKSADQSGIEANIKLFQKCNNPTVRGAIKNITNDGFEVTCDDLGISDCMVNVSWKNAYYKNFST